MYIPFLIYVIVVIVLVGLVASDKFRAFFVAVIFAAALLYGAFAARNAIAEEEVRTAYLKQFDLATSCFILEDEDGYLWAFKLEEDDYSLGDEYVLHLPENEEPYYEEV